VTAAAVYLDVRGACEFCCLSRRTLDYAKDRGDVPFIRKGKKIVFRVADLVAFMDRDLIDVTADVDRMEAGL
jgi:Fe-S cluster biogenesis protein NfuA